jgi:putative endonuclease
MKGTVYILKSGDGRLYTGSTTDLSRRLAQHRQGHTHSTKRMSALELVFSQEFSDLAVARKIELRLKKFRRKDFLEKIIRDGRIKLLGV